MTRRPRPPPAIPESARVAAWIVGLQAALTGLGSLLASHRAGSLAVQAFVAEWGAGRLGVAWSNPEAPLPPARLVARRLGSGLALGVGVAIVAVAFAAATRAVTLATTRGAPAELFLGFVVVGLVALRDELLLRGLVLRAFGVTLSPRLRLLVCAAVATAARWGQMDGPASASFSAAAQAAPALLVAAFEAVCFATLWLRERGAFMAWGAHVGWSLVTTTVISGGLLDARWSASWWGGGALGLDASMPVLIAPGVTATLPLSKWYRDDAGTR